MLIICQSRETILNFDNVVGMELNGGDIEAKLVDGSEITLAAYREQERAYEVFNTLMAVDTSKSKVIIFPEK